MGQTQGDLRTWALPRLEWATDAVQPPGDAGQGQDGPTNQLLPDVCPEVLEWRERGGMKGAVCVQAGTHDQHVWSASKWAKRNLEADL